MYLRLSRGAYTTGEKEMSDTNIEKIRSIDELPEDPLAMPPPYWRGGGAIFHVLDSLRGLSNLLRELLPVHERTERDLERFSIWQNRFGIHNVRLL